MAIRVAIQGATQLQLASPVLKPGDFTAGRTIGGASGQIMGYWLAFMLRVPSGTAWESNLRRFLLGGGSGSAYAGTITEAGSNTSTNLGAVWLGSDTDNASTFSGSLRLRPRVVWRHGANTTGYFPTGAALPSTTPTGPNEFTGLAPITRGNDAWLFVVGVSNVAAQGAPAVWRIWAANCRIGPGGTVSSQVPDYTPANSNWLPSTTAELMRQVFGAASGTVTSNTPVDTTMEHVALCQGNFPWDTANNRPHHDAIAALAGVAGVAPHSYDTLVAAQNAGTLGYANLRSGRGDLTHHWTLADLTSAGLTSSGSAAPVAFAPVNYNSLSGGLADTATIAPLHWQGGAPTISEPPVKFHGGRGTRAFTIGGTYQAGTTGLQRRWETADGAALPGLDWADVTVFGGAGTWSTTDMLPVGGPYRLRVRDTNDVARATAMAGLLVGTVMLAHGQSGMAQALRTGDNVLGVAVAAGAIGLYVGASNNDAGGASYVKPVPVVYDLVGGQTPPVASHGSILLLNEWNQHNPGHPLCIANQAIGGRDMALWAANGAWGQWSFLGSVGEPGTSSAGGVGRTGHFAWMLGQYVDCHVLMWTPNMASAQADRTLYANEIDARFTASPDVPWLVLPAWRGHRSPPDPSATVNKRGEHVSFVAERGARGVLGPYWPDIVMDGNPNAATSGDQGSLHSAYHSNATAGSGGSPVSDQNQVGQGRLGRSIGRALAWVFDRSVKAHGPRVVAAWFRDDARTVIEVELGRAVRTLNGAAIANHFWVSSDSGSIFAKTGFTVALDATATRAVLTSTGGAWPASTTRVDYARNWPNGPADGDLLEQDVERKLDGLLYDDQAYRGGTNLAARAGNPLASANGIGVAVAARGAAKLVATERWTGTRNVTVRMMAADGVTVLRERVLAVTAN